MIAFRNTASNYKTHSSSQITKQSTTKPGNTTSNEYKGWLTYTNPTYGYSFKYPANWVINTSGAIPQTANNATASANTSTVTLTYNGYVFTFQYDITGIGSGESLLSKVEPITIDNHNYDIAFHADTQISSCPSFQGPPGSANSDPPNPPIACKEYTNGINLENIKYVLPGYYSDIFMQINNNSSLIDLKLPQDLLTSTIDSNPEVQIFKKVLASIILPK